MEQWEIDELEDTIDELRDMLADTEDMLMDAGYRINTVKHICQQELAIIDKEGGTCRGYQRILAVLDADKS